MSTHSSIELRLKPIQASTKAPPSPSSTSRSKRNLNHPSPFFNIDPDHDDERSLTCTTITLRTVIGLSVFSSASALIVYVAVWAAVGVQEQSYSAFHLALFATSFACFMGTGLTLPTRWTGVSKKCCNCDCFFQAWNNFIPTRSESAVLFSVFWAAQSVINFMAWLLIIFETITLFQDIDFSSSQFNGLLASWIVAVIHTVIETIFVITARCVNKPFTYLFEIQENTISAKDPHLRTLVGRVVDFTGLSGCAPFDGAIYIDQYDPRFDSMVNDKFRRLSHSRATLGAGGRFTFHPGSFKYFNQDTPSIFLIYAKPSRQFVIVRTVVLKFPFVIKASGDDDEKDPGKAREKAILIQDSETRIQEELNALEKRARPSASVQMEIEGMRGIAETAEPSHLHAVLQLVQQLAARIDQSSQETKQGLAHLDEQMGHMSDNLEFAMTVEPHLRGN